MNFLAHYHLQGENKNRYFNYGLLLPDLIGMHDRKCKVQPEDLDDIIQSEKGQLKDVALGFKAHLEADAYFHNAPFFEEGTAIITRELKKALPENHPFRLFFLSHIALELLLDKYIIHHHEAVIPEFYKELDLIEPEMVRTLFQKLGLKEVSTFWAFQQKFRQKEFAYHYQKMDDLVKIILQIHRRVGLPTGKDAAEKALVAGLKNAEKKINFNNFVHLQSFTTVLANSRKNE